MMVRWIYDLKTLTANPGQIEVREKDLERGTNSKTKELESNKTKTKEYLSRAKKHDKISKATETTFRNEQADGIQYKKVDKKQFWSQLFL